MKLLSALFATFMLSLANAQSSEPVVYMVDTQTKIQSLRLSTVNSCGEEESTSSPIIGVSDSTVTLSLNPYSDYELMVNNTIFIPISSEDILESITPVENPSPVSLVVAKNWFVEEE